MNNKPLGALAALNDTLGVSLELYTPEIEMTEFPSSLTLNWRHDTDLREVTDNQNIRRITELIGPLGRDWMLLRDPYETHFYFRSNLVKNSYLICMRREIDLNERYHKISSDMNEGVIGKYISERCAIFSEFMNNTGLSPYDGVTPQSFEHRLLLKSLPRPLRKKIQKLIPKIIENKLPHDVYKWSIAWNDEDKEFIFETSDMACMRLLTLISDKECNRIMNESLNETRAHIKDGQIIMLKSLPLENLGAPKFRGLGESNSTNDLLKSSHANFRKFKSRDR